MKYTHSAMNEEVEFIAGSYELDREERVQFNGKEIFYVVGRTGNVSTCCGMLSPFSFAKVIGFVQKWKHATDENGMPVSDVEPVRGESLQNSVKDFVHQTDPDIESLHIDFW